MKIGNAIRTGRRVKRRAAVLIARSREKQRLPRFSAVGSGYAFAITPSGSTVGYECVYTVGSVAEEASSSTSPRRGDCCSRVRKGGEEKQRKGRSADFPGPLFALLARECS